MENENLNLERLEYYLKYAVSTTPFYKEYESNNLLSFPVIDKNIIRENWNAMHSKRYCGALHYMSTSGSTGTPFTMEWDIEKRRRQLAEVVYFQELANQKLGQPYIYFRVWMEKNQKSKKVSWTQNLIAINILHLDDTVLEEIRERLKQKPYINYYLGYASTFEHLIRYLKSKGDSPEMFHTASIVSSSEVLNLEMKQTIKDVLGCKVFDRYSNEENGFLAQTDDLSDVFKVNIASFYIEILKLDSDKPAEIGEIGRIVITDLYSCAVPLIRYDTGDLGIKHREINGWVTEIKSIQGRQVDVIYDTKGRKMTPLTWSVYMWKYDKLKQYQFIQEGEKEYILKLNGAEGLYADYEFVTYIKSIIGEDADITIEHVDEIPVLASGKFKKTVCNYNPKTVIRKGM